MKWIRIVGVVVAIEQFNIRRVYTIDDSSGACVEAIATGKHVYEKADTNKVRITSLQGVSKGTGDRDDALHALGSTGGNGEKTITFPFEDIDVGAIVDIKGKLTTFRDEKQINIEKLVTVRSTAQEVALWEKRNDFHNEVLAKPWVLSPELVKKCRRQAERSEEQAERRKKRLRARADQEPERQTAEASTGAHRQGKRQRPVLRRTEIASMIQSSGVKGKFSALGL